MPIVYPSLPSPRLTPAEAGAIAARARELADIVGQAEADAQISPLFYKTWT